jgi:hypothetical protein
MRSIGLLVVITTLSAGAWCGRAQAMPPAAPSVLGVPNAAAPLLEQVANICGLSGCSPVWTKRIQKPPAGFAKRAAPIVVQAHQTQNAAPLAPVK